MITVCPLKTSKRLSLARMSHERPETYVVGCVSRAPKPPRLPHFVNWGRSQRRKWFPHHRPPTDPPNLIHEDMKTWDMRPLWTGKIGAYAHKNDISDILTRVDVMMKCISKYIYIYIIYNSHLYVDYLGHIFGLFAERSSFTWLVSRRISQPP